MNTTIQHTTKYKSSPLGLIPEDWEVKKFKEIAKFYSGGTPSTSIREYYEGTIPFIKSGEIYGEITEQFLNDIALKNSSAKMVFKGDILYALYGANSGEVAISKIEGAINQAVLCVRTELNNLFIYNFLINNKDVIVKKYLQGGQGNLSADIVKKLDIPIPPVQEQKAIADCLSTWDKAIEKQNILIAQKELSKKALMQQLLSGKKRLKGFSDKWDLKSLEEVATFKNGKAHENGIDEDGAYKVVNSKFVSTNGTVFKSTNDNLCPLFVNDIAMVMSDIPNGKALAKCFYVDENNKYTLNQRICSITANKDTNSKFLFFILNRNVHYLSFDNGVGQTNLKKEEVLECPLLMPDFREQTAIANVLQCADEELQLLKKKLEQLKEQKKGLMQVLLTGKKRLKY
jgi:type I restriction enzyme S subunit